MHNPEKNDSTISAIAEGAILGNRALLLRHDPISLIWKHSELPCFQKTGIAVSSTSPRLKFFGLPRDILSDKELNSSIFLHPRHTLIIIWN
jgi:hypothetical protein